MERRQQVVEGLPSKASWYLIVLATIEVTMLVVSNVLASIIWGFDIPCGRLGILHIVQDGGLLTFPLIYITADLINELFGMKVADRIMMLSVTVDAALAMIFYLATQLPVIDGTGSVATQQALSLSGRILIASITSFIISQKLNNTLYAAIRERTRYENYKARSLISSVIARIFDTVVFNLLAFYGRYDDVILGQQVFWALIIPTMLEVLFNPIAKRVAKCLGDSLDRERPIPNKRYNNLI